MLDFTNTYKTLVRDMCSINEIQYGGKRIKKDKRMSQQAIKEVQKSGMSISKEKLIEAIRKSSQTTFILSQSPNSKEAAVVISL